MRVGLLVNSLPTALRIHDELKAHSDWEQFILLCPTRHESRSGLRHIARLFLKRGRWKSLRALLAGRVHLLRKPLDHPETIAGIRDLNLDIGLHKTGEIYRQPTIDAFRLGILNPHIGLLPRYRGRNVMEWSVLRGDPVGITVFFIDAGIDTGERIVLAEEVSIKGCRSILEAKQRLFDLDAEFFRRALELLQASDFEYQKNDGSGQRHYVMSQLFRTVVEKQILSSRGGVMNPETHNSKLKTHN